jgi:hypothetical protein
LSYAWGLPKATLELAGGFANLSQELSAALAEARVRRAALDAAVPVAGLVDAASAILALPAATTLDAEVIPEPNDDEKADA